MYPHVIGEIMRLTGCSQADAERAVEAVGMDVVRAVEWLRATMTDRLSPHFALAELTRTSTGLTNVPTADHLVALTALCSTLLEPVRARFGPVAIHSGYRSAAVNAKIGGSKTSQHMRGEAADLHVPGHSLTEVFRWIVTESGLRFGQVILEGHTPAEPSWIHLSLGEPWRVGSSCRQALTFDGARYSAWRG